VGFVNVPLEFFESDKIRLHMARAETIESFNGASYIEEEGVVPLREVRAMLVDPTLTGTSKAGTSWESWAAAALANKPLPKGHHIIEDYKEGPDGQLRYEAIIYTVPGLLGSFLSKFRHGEVMAKIGKVIAPIDSQYPPAA
jgi:hypothetical protein